MIFAGGWNKILRWKNSSNNMRKSSIIVMLGLYACSFKESPPFVTTLTSPNICWGFYSYPDEQRNNEEFVSSCTKFYDDQTFAPFVIKDKRAKTILSLDKNVSNSGEWEFDAADSTFYVGGHIFKMMTFNSDTITLINENNHVQKLVKAQLEESK
jgi:hypothetical protein